MSHYGAAFISVCAAATAVCAATFSLKASNFGNGVRSTPTYLRMRDGGEESPQVFRAMGQRQHDERAGAILRPAQDDVEVDSRHVDLVGMDLRQSLRQRKLLGHL